MPNISVHWLKLKSYKRNTEKIWTQWFSMGSAIEWANSLEGSSQSYGIVNLLSPMSFALNTIANSITIFHYFLYNFLIFSKWPLIFDIIKFNSSLYRLVLKILKFKGYRLKVFLLINFKQFLCDEDNYVIFIRGSFAHRTPHIFHNRELRPNRPTCNYSSKNIKPSKP